MLLNNKMILEIIGAILGMGAAAACYGSRK
jgi:hypothetical protein